MSIPHAHACGSALESAGAGLPCAGPASRRRRRASRRYRDTRRSRGTGGRRHIRRGRRRSAPDRSPSTELADEVVVARLGDAHAPHLARVAPLRRRGRPDRRCRGPGPAVAAHHHELVLVARPLDQRTSSSRPIIASLFFCEILRCRLMSLRWRAARVRAGPCPRCERARRLLVRVAEDADAIELGPLHEVAELLELLVGLAGVAHDERGAEREAGDARAEIAHDLAEARAAVAAPHAAEHAVGRVLQRHVDVGHDTFGWPASSSTSGSVSVSG
jgi:hypothetical protein